MAKPKIQFDNSAWNTTNRYAAWNRQAASNSLRSTKAWADRLSKAELAAGQVTFEEVESETFPGLVKRIYTHVEQAVQTEAATVVEAAPAPKPKAAKRKRRQQKESRSDKWKRLASMRTEMDRLNAEYAQ